jgi:hypothetical protein
MTRVENYVALAAYILCEATPVMATISAAMNAPANNNASLLLMSIHPSLVGRRKKGVQRPPTLACYSDLSIEAEIQHVCMPGGYSF